jgi:hypothetical protein
MPNKTVETDDSKFGRRKYKRGHKVKVRWVYHGVERESGKKLLVPVSERNPDWFMAVLRDWLERVTTISVTAVRYTGTQKRTATHTHTHTHAHTKL